VVVWRPPAGDIIWVHAAARCSDSPRPEGSWPQTTSRLMASFKALPEDQIAAILGANAAESYGFDAAKLAPLGDRIGPEKRLFRAA